MIWTIYFIILGYFFLGSIAFYFINRKKEAKEARKSWIKFITYFIIIHILFFSIVIYTPVFKYIALIIIVAGSYELYNVFNKSGFRHRNFFLLSLSLFMIFSLGFFLFSIMEKRLILFAFLLLSIFDSFSQISGQLWGKRKIFPEISPNKTIEGFFGGFIMVVLSALLLKSLVASTYLNAILLAIGIAVFAFLGDMVTSLYKRTYNVKDYSNLIPGHGGFLDRFDSLIAGGTFITLYKIISNF
jgi:phosphatidate cytidylyltransferase